jgi:HAD superfamily hydrolase (TIGR01509 family)
MADSQVKLVIFDLDGTLYDLPAMHRRMARELIGHYLPRPHRWSEVQALSSFRRQRESLTATADVSVADEQYRVVADTLGWPDDRVRAVVDEWIHDRPLKHLPALRFNLAPALFNLLGSYEISRAVVSDLPAETKLAALGLEPDFVTDSTHPAVNALKPDPAGFLHAAAQFDCSPENCLVVGDRPDKDGLAAEQAGMRFLLGLEELADWLTKQP